MWLNLIGEVGMCGSLRLKRISWHEEECADFHEFVYVKNRVCAILFYILLL